MGDGDGDINTTVNVNGNDGNIITIVGAKKDGKPSPKPTNNRDVFADVDVKYNNGNIITVDPIQSLLYNIFGIMSSDLRVNGDQTPSRKPTNNRDVFNNVDVNNNSGNVITAQNVGNIQSLINDIFGNIGREIPTKST